MSLGGGPRPGGRPRPAPGSRLTVALGGLRPHPLGSKAVQWWKSRAFVFHVFQCRFILDFDRCR